MSASKFTPGRRKTVIAAMERGHYAKHAAALAGIGVQTLTDWLIRGRDSERGPYRKFLEDFERAEAVGVNRHVEVIVEAEDPRVSMDWLGRRHRDEYGKTTRTEHTGADGKPLTVRLEWSPGPAPPE